MALYSFSINIMHLFTNFKYDTYFSLFGDNFFLTSSVRPFVLTFLNGALFCLP